MTPVDPGNEPSNLHPSKTVSAVIDRVSRDFGFGLYPAEVRMLYEYILRCDYIMKCEELLRMRPIGWSTDERAAYKEIFDRLAHRTPPPHAK